MKTVQPSQNQGKMMEKDEPTTFQEKMRAEIDSRIEHEAKPEFAALRKAESVHQRTGELIAAEEGKVADLRADGESIICQLKTAPPDEIMTLSKREVQLDREIEEMLEGIKNLTSMLPQAKEALEKAAMEYRVKVLLIARDWRDCFATKIQIIVKTQLEPMLAAHRDVSEAIVLQYNLISIQDRYKGGDVQNIHLTSALVFDAVKDGDPAYKHWITTRHPLQNLTPEQFSMVTEKSGHGSSIVL